MKKMIFITLLAMITALLFTFPAFADDGSLGRTPEGVFPINENDIEMKSEDITVDLESGKVECIFVFHNTGPAKEVYMGFPGKIDEKWGGDNTDPVNLSLKNFKAYVNSEELKVNHEKGIELSDIPWDLPPYEEWFAFTVPFKAGETVTVRNTYDVTFSSDSIGEVFCGYVLRTGSLWKGPIGKARVTFSLGGIKPYQVELLEFGMFTFKDNAIVWERENFEPLYDLRVIYNNFHYSNDFLEMVSAEESQKIRKRMDDFNKIPDMAKKNDYNGLADMYREASETRDMVLSQYIAGFIPKDKLPEGGKPEFSGISVINENGSHMVICDTKNLYISAVEGQVSHNDNGQKIIDREIESPYFYMRFIRGIEYDISITLRDWLDQTYQKSIKYIVPDPDEVDSAAAILPSTVSSQEVTAGPQEKSGLDSTFFWGITAIIIAGLFVVVYFYFKKVRQRKQG